MIRGVPVFDGVAVGEFTASFLGPSVKLVAKAAFVASRTGQTHGWTTHEQWSQPTLDKLKELRALMDMDVARVHFNDGASQAQPPGVAFAPAPVGGIGEFLAGDAPSI